MFKSIPQNLIMAEAVPYGQKWTYHANHPIEALIEPEYFKSETRFQAGDELRVIQSYDVKKEVIAFADMLIMSVRPLQFHFLRKPEQIIAKKKTIEIVQGQNCWELREGEDLVDTFPSKRRAEIAKENYEKAATKGVAA